MEEEQFFPFIGVEDDYVYQSNKELPLFEEFAYNFEINDFIFDEKGEIKILQGVEALKIWIKKALLTDRFVHEIYSWDYGTELVTLVGQKFSQGFTESEAFRYVTEALLTNPYIENVTNNGIKFDGDNLTINIIVETIYGEVNISV